MAIKYIDAKRLRYALIGGGKWIQKHESYLNELNVYPVPDGDTGTNMSMTAQTMITEIEENTNRKSTMDELIEVVEDAVLIGARGNSGTIFSQIITGFLKGIQGLKKVYPKDIVVALENANKLAYKVVDTPVEGTMLTVIRMVSEEIKQYEDVEYLDELIDKIVEISDKAVQMTPDLLPKLKEAGVVDSGAKGLYYFFVGMRKVLTEIELLSKDAVVENEFDKSIMNVNHNSDEIKFKYCTEFIINNTEFDDEELKKQLLEIGDSAVFAKSSKKFKAHIHTNNPGIVIEKANELGNLSNIKIENMKLQNEGVLENEKEMAKIFVNNKKMIRGHAYIILADTMALKDEFLKMGADIVILGGQGKNPSVNDILNAISRVDEQKTIYILPNNKNVISTANLAIEKTDSTVIVLPTKTMLEGMFYLQYNFNTIKEKENMSKFNNSIEITRAVRDTKVDSMDINIGDYLVLVDTKIKYVEKSLQQAIDKILNELINPNTLSLTVVKGNDSENVLENRLKNFKFAFKTPTKFINGEMENYEYYIHIENKDPKLPKYAIVTDSSSELSAQKVEGQNIFVIPIRLNVGDNEYKDGLNLTKQEFWNKLVNENAKFKTAQPSPKEIANLYNDIFRQGYEKVVVMCISKKLSGTHQVLNLAREITKREDDIMIYDTNAISIILGHMVLEANRKLKNGENLKDVLNYLDRLVQNSKIYILVDSLKYLYEGGRISKVSQTIGDFLSLKPVLSVSDGSLYVDKKVFGGDGAAARYIEKSINEIAKNHSIYLMSVFGGTSKQLEMAKSIVDNLKNNKRITTVLPIEEAGPTVGTHAGPVCAFLAVPKLL